MIGVFASMAGGPSLGHCDIPHDIRSDSLTAFILVGLIVSYLPQILRIVNKGTSEGFSTAFLLLGATSSASGMLNVLVVQWSLFQCCRVTGPGDCFLNLMGFFQVFLQWFLFSIMQVTPASYPPAADHLSVILYLVYFPRHLKYHRTLGLADEGNNSRYQAISNSSLATESNILQEPINGTTRPVKANVETTPAWRQAVLMGIVVALHILLLLGLSLTLLHTLPSTTPPHPALGYLATFLGLSGTVLAICQYAPQIYQTYTSQLVGALSIGTMIIQVPGALFFIISLAVRPGVDWTSWLPYAVTAGMQSALLALCVVWKRRQKREGIDDFGNPLQPDTTGGTPTEQDRLVQ